MALILQTFITTYFKPEDGIDWGGVVENLIQLFALAFAILSFRNTNISTSKFQKAQTKKNWFLSIIIQPNLEKLSQFYDDSFSFLEEGLATLSQYQDNPLFDGTTFIEIKAAEIAKFQKERNAINFSFIEMINSYDRSLNIKLISCLNDLEDIYVSTLDAPDYLLLDMYQIESSIHKNKATFFNHLFAEVNKDLN